jgi:hypothetical protein
VKGPWIYADDNWFMITEALPGERATAMMELGGRVVDYLEADERNVRLHGQP